MSTLYWPFPLSTVTEWPGQRFGSYHVGTDFGIPQGTPLRATIDGACSRWTDQYGAYIVDIRSDDGLIVRNGHLSRIDVTNGQRVAAGDIIGLTGGQPGTPGAGWSTGPHLHWELRRGSAWIDPRNLNPQPKSFDDVPVEEDDDTMLTMWRNKVTGEVIAASVHTGFIYAVPSPHYANLLRVRGMVKDQNWIDMAPSEWDFLLHVLRLAQKNVQATNVGDVVAKVDNAAIAKAVNDDAARRLAQ